ncbi:MAG: GNAT family N-acetyltransferase [Rhizobiaceae bacterium]|nr:GNAT family N-acetyltransferase [Rhizobiaceae bacterium]
MTFDAQPHLLSHRLELRPLVHEDFDALYLAASDPETWAGHPAKDRHERPTFKKYFAFLMEAGGVLAIVDRETGEVIGCSRYYVSPDVPDMISIGFTFLDKQYWGGATNREMKRLMLEHAFKSFDEVWFHIDPSNIRSQKATAKLGAECIANRELNLAGNPAEWKCWRLKKEDWNSN